MKSTSIYVSAAVIVVLLLIAVGWRNRDKDEIAEVASTKTAALARCLTAKGAVMYGADWCPHCQNEKKNFDEAFKYINYVECPNEPKKCLEAGINGYPTWVFPDGKRLEGEQGIEKLTRESQCDI